MNDRRRRRETLTTTSWSDNLMVGCSVCDLSHPRNVGISELFSASLDGIDTGLEYQADTTFRHARLVAFEVVRR